MRLNETEMERDITSEATSTQRIKAYIFQSAFTLDSGVDSMSSGLSDISLLCVCDKMPEE